MFGFFFESYVLSEYQNIVESLWVNNVFEKGICEDYKHHD